MNAYNGVTRSIRRSMLLAQKFTEPAKAPVSDEAAQKRIATRKAIIRRVEDTIHREAKAAEAADLHAELLERIESPDFDGDLTQRPAAEIIKDLCADLGLGPDSLHWWKRRTPQDIAILCARAAAPCRDRTGPFNLPMPPRGWDGGVRPYGDAIPPIRGP
jgi:hypothetical protein